MSYHNNSSGSSGSSSSSQRKAAPPGFHYMPDGSLMADSEMGTTSPAQKVTPEFTPRLSSNQNNFLDSKQIKDYLPQQIEGYPSQQITPQSPQQLSSKRKNFLSMTGRLSDYLSARKYDPTDPTNPTTCLLDISIAIDVSGSVGYGIPNSELANAQNGIVTALIDAFTPQMNAGNIQMGICTFGWDEDFDKSFGIKYTPNVTAANGYPVGPQRPNSEVTGIHGSGDWLSNDPAYLLSFVTPNTAPGGMTGGGTNVRQGLIVGRQNVNRAQTHPTECSLGDRTGQPNFRRIVIVITDAERGAGDMGQYGERGFSMETAVDLWEDRDHLTLYNGTPSGATATTLGAMATLSTPGPGYNGGHGKVETYFIRTEPSAAPPTRAQELEWRKKIQPLSGKSGTTPGRLFGIEECNSNFAKRYYDWHVWPGGMNNYGAFPNQNYPEIHYGAPPYPTGVATAFGPIPFIPPSVAMYVSNCPNYLATGGDYNHTFAGNLASLLPGLPSSSLPPGVPYTIELIIDSLCTDLVPDTWNCTPAGCINLGDGLGRYNNLSTCQDQCTIYECVRGPLGHFCNPHAGGQAVLLANQTLGLPWYSTLQDCQQQCVPESWNCVGIGIPGSVTYACLNPYNGLGQYNASNGGLAACQAACGPTVIPDTWDCESDTDPLGNTPPSYYCIQKFDGSGQYNSLVACQDSCRDQPQPPTQSWDCDEEYNCYDPGTGLGQYATLSACQADCKP